MGKYLVLVIAALLTGCSTFKVDSIDLNIYAESDYAFIKIGLVFGNTQYNQYNEDYYIESMRDTFKGRGNGGGSSGCSNCSLR